jgi:ribosomal protein S18 acetylase RimI-like enzyme
MVSPIERGGHAAVGAVLGRAFDDDPLWSVIFPGNRLPKLISMFEALSRATRAAGGIVEVTPGISGAAMWMPPGTDDGLWSAVRSGFALPRFAMRLPVRERKMMLAVLSQFDDRRKLLMPAPHWYLSAVGIDPSRQGEGLGSALVRTGMHRADLDGRPIYLETETDSNVRFYERLGFEVLEETVATGLGLPVWLMSRPSD